MVLPPVFILVLYSVMFEGLDFHYMEKGGEGGKRGGGLFFADKFGNQIQVWKHAKYLVKQIGPLTPTNFASKNFHHHHHRTIHLTSQKPSTFQVDKIDQTNSSC